MCLSRQGLYVWDTGTCRLKATHRSHRPRSKRSVSTGLGGGGAAGRGDACSRGACWEAGETQGRGREVVSGTGRAEGRPAQCDAGRGVPVTGLRLVPNAASSPPSADLGRVRSLPKRRPPLRQPEATAWAPLPTESGRRADPQPITRPELLVTRTR